jgi:copper chaperone CopZ
MKKLQHLLLGMFLLMTFSACAAQIKNAKTESYQVSGNCEMCKNTIETAASKKGVSSAEWNKDTKVLRLTYDSVKTSVSEILKKVAYAGYDNEEFLAPDEAYSKLPECCRYARNKKEVQTSNSAVKDAPKNDNPVKSQEKTEALATVYDQYFALKDALVKDDGNTAASKATSLVKSIKSVDMKAMSSEEHTAWMKAEKDLLTHAGDIATTKDIAKQREHFSMLSQNMLALVKIFKPGKTVYLQHCPMYKDGEGADWLSRENAVKNPYYGSSMLTCGKTTETIR